MHSPETPKMPSGKASKGTVQVIASHDRLQLRFRYGGERHYFSVGLPDTPTGRMVAQQRASQIQLDILSGNFDTTLAKYKTAPTEPEKAKPTAPSLPELWEKFCEVKEPVVAPGTWRNGYCVNTSHLGRCPHKQLKDAHKVFDWAMTHLNPDPAKRFIQALSSCCRWAKRNDLIDQNPFEGLSGDIKIPKTSEDKTDIDPFTRAERQAIISGFENNRYYAYYSPVVRFLFCTGCRPSEAAGLQWKHITTDDIIFDQAVVDSVRGRVLKDGLKTQLKRKFPINKQLRQLLTAHQPSQARRSDLVFPSPEGQFMNFHNFRNRGWSAVLEELGIRYRKPYQARHTFITHCLEEGISVSQVAKWVGNSPEIIMKHYAGTLARFQVPEI
jgi:integrase